MRYANILETIGNTPLVELKSFNPRPGVQIFAKLEGVNPSGSIKDRIAKKMIEQAESQHLLKADSILLEPTSGNTGVALALVANMKGIHLQQPYPRREPRISAGYSNFMGPIS